MLFSLQIFLVIEIALKLWHYIVVALINFDKAIVLVVIAGMFERDKHTSYTLFLCFTCLHSFGAFVSTLLALNTIR